jgi:endoglucanase
MAMVKTRWLSMLLMTGFLWIACKKKEAAAPLRPGVSESPQSLHADGRWIVNEDGAKVILRGVNIPSLEWTVSGENMLRSLDSAVVGWHSNLVRIPLSQDRWFGKTSGQNDEGRSYQSLVDRLVQSCTEKKCYILLELHWNDAGVWGGNIGQHKMPDSNSVVFHRSLAAKYGNVPAVLLGLYNEPHDISWDVWLNGGQVTEDFEQNGGTTKLSYRTIGFQALYDTVRAAGAADNLIVIGGLDWAFDLSGVLNGHAVSGRNIVYDTHPYPWKDVNWDGKFGNTGRQTAILVGEWGGSFLDGYRTYANNMAAYLRANKFCWTAWSFHPSAGPSLIQDWNYTTTGIGGLVKNELKIPVSPD